MVILYNLTASHPRCVWSMCSRFDTTKSSASPHFFVVSHLERTYNHCFRVRQGTQHLEMLTLYQRHIYERIHNIKTILNVVYLQIYNSFSYKMHDIVISFCALCLSMMNADLKVFQYFHHNTHTQIQVVLNQLKSFSKQDTENQVNSVPNPLTS